MEKKTTKLWRLHTKTDSSSQESVAQYCINSGCLAMGWSLKDEHISCKSMELTAENNKMPKQRNKIKTFEEYGQFVKRFNIYKGQSKTT